MSTVAPHLFFVGAGHAHVEVLRRMGEERRPPGRVTVVSPTAWSAYSGMLPGLIAGHYSWAQCHVDVARLCDLAGADFMHGQAAAIDAGAQVLRLRDGRVVGWDLLSLNTGSTPDLSAVSGASGLAIAVKPVPAFLAALESFVGGSSGDRSRGFTVVGGGAAGVEVALAVHFRLARITPAAEMPVTLVTDTLLRSHPASARRRALGALHAAGIRVAQGRRVQEARPGELILDDGMVLPSGFTAWATGGAAPAWLRRGPLALDARGFPVVDATLRSVSHPRILVAGDAASFAEGELPKAGVYAVRQGPILADNLDRLLRGQTPRTYRPQRRFLSLVSLGSRRAIASWGPFTADGSWAWWLKDRIDRRFMLRYSAAGDDVAAAA